MGGCKEGGFELIGIEKERVYLCLPQAVWCCNELLIIIVVEMVIAEII